MRADYTHTHTHTHRRQTGDLLLAVDNEGVSNKSASEVAKYERACVRERERQRERGRQGD